MYYGDVIKEIIESKSLIKGIDLDNPQELKKIQELADRINIKKDCMTIIEFMKRGGSNGRIGTSLTKDAIINEQKRMIEQIADAAAFFCALAFRLDGLLSRTD